jgi:hypothetical protein
MKNTNISCIEHHSVASYGCKGMTLRRRVQPDWRSILSKLRHWPPGTDNKPFVPSFLPSTPPIEGHSLQASQSQRKSQTIHFEPCWKFLAKPLLLVHVRIRFSAEFFHGLGIIGINSKADTRADR